MSSEWKTLTLSEVALNGKEGLVDGPFGSALPADSYKPSGVPVIRGSNLSRGAVRFKGDEFVFVSEELAQRLSRATCIPDDIVFTKKGTLGQVGIVPHAPHTKYLLSSNQMRLRVNRDLIRPDFAYYYVSQKSSIDKILRDSEHTGVPKINLAYLRAFPITVPPLAAQDLILSVLKNLDLRIALLRETNATLEAIAQALFKSWFVDFDPVHANAGTQAPSLPAEIQALFPSRLVESPQGLIPEGWESADIGDHLDVLATGRRPKGGVASFSEGIPSIGAESINGIGNFDFAKTKYVPLEFFEKMKSGLIADYDVLLYKDGGKPGEFKPRVSMFGNSFPFETFAINEHVFRMRSDYLGQAFLYFYVSHERTLNELSNRGGKAAIPGINQTDVKTLKLIVPSKCVLEEFQSRVEPLLCNILANASKSHNLANLRDTLLPRLISGQLRLPEAEAALAEVV